MSWSLVSKKRVLYLLHTENIAARHILSIGQPLEVLQNDSSIILLGYKYAPSLCMSGDTSPQS